MVFNRRRMIEQTPAILLRKARWSETSLIVTWITERFGTLRTVARGALRPKSPLAGRLDLFYDAEISLVLSSRSDLHTLREVSVNSVFDLARTGTGGFYLACYFGELAGIAAPAMHPSSGVFDLLRRGLRFAQRRAPTMKALSHFEKELCHLLGVYDSTGEVGAITALASLYGTIPASREEALKFLRP